MAEVGEVGSLGLILEKDPDLRDLGRREKSLTQWPSEDTIGIPSCPAIARNLRLITTVLEWWGQQSEKPKPIPIDVVRAEARSPWSCLLCFCFFGDMCGFVFWILLMSFRILEVVVHNMCHQYPEGEGLLEENGYLCSRKDLSDGQLGHQKVDNT